jgi:hypothetical protein
MDPGKQVFDVRRGDEWIRVTIDGEVAEFVVVGIDDVAIVIEALNKAASAGAIRGTMFTGEIVDDHAAAMHRMRAAGGVTWLGGKVSLIGERPIGPMFRIDWDVLPAITE